MPQPSGGGTAHVLDVSVIDDGTAIWTFDTPVINEGTGAGLLVAGNAGNSPVIDPDPHQLEVGYPGATVYSGVTWQTTAVDLVFAGGATLAPSSGLVT